MARSIKAPAELAPSGRRLWANCLHRDDALADSGNPMRRVLLDACRVADIVDRLDESLTTVQLVTDGKVTNLLAESARQRALLARLLTALRIPDESTGKRPARLAGTKMSRPPRPGGRASVTALDRVRAGGAG